MKCPYCKKEVYGMTGLQEIQKFQKHLRRCKKVPDDDRYTDMRRALDIRDESDQ